MLIHGNDGIILLIGVGGFKFKALNLVDMFHPTIAIHRRHIMAFGFKSQSLRTLAFETPNISISCFRTSYSPEPPVWWWRLPTNDDETRASGGGCLSTVTGFSGVITLFL